MDHRHVGRWSLVGIPDQHVANWLCYLVEVQDLPSVNGDAFYSHNAGLLQQRQNIFKFEHVCFNASFGLAAISSLKAASRQTCR